MDASIVICTYNRAASLKRTLTSLAEMECPPGITWEVIVVDNNSKDETKSITEDFIRTSKINVIYVFEQTQGKSFALNKGSSVAKGKVLAYTDDDVIVHSDWLNNIINAFQSTNAACVGGKILLAWEKPCPIWLDRKLVEQLGYLDLGEKPVRLTLPNLYGANFAVKSSVAEKYGFFNTKMGPIANKMYHAEDTNFINTLITSGEEVYYVPSIIVNHCIPAKHVRKMYFLKRMFDQAELKGIQMGDYRFRTIFGIPLYIFKEVFIKTMEFLGLLMVKPSRAFRKQIELSECFGIISGRFKYIASEKINNQ